MSSIKAIKDASLTVSTNGWTLWELAEKQLIQIRFLGMLSELSSASQSSVVRLIMTSTTKFYNH